MKAEQTHNFKPMEFVSELFGKLTVLVDSDGMSWFPASELTKKLNLNRTNTRRLDLMDKKKIKGKENNAQAMLYVNEPGMYELILASRKPEAKAFKRWICSEVIPSIRQNGGYILGQEALAPEARQDLEEKIRALSQEVARVNAGKAKLQNYLLEEEDRCMAQADRIRELLGENSKLSGELKNVRTDFSSVAHAERYVVALKTMRCFDERKEEFRATDREREEKESRIKYAQNREPDPDPLVNDGFGIVCRRSELMA